MKIFTKLLTTTFLFLFLTSPLKAQSPSCDIEINPSSGPIGAEFTLNLTNCNPSNGTYTVDVLGNTTTYLQTHNVVVNDGTGTLNIFDEPSMQGDYSISIYFESKPLGTRELFVQATEASCDSIQASQMGFEKKIQILGNGCKPEWTDVRIQIFDEAGAEVYTSLASVNAGVIDFIIYEDVTQYNKQYLIEVKYLDIPLLSKKIFINTSRNNLFCDPDQRTQINTAIGCIPIKTNTEFLSFLLRWSIGVAGAFAVLLILYASFIFITSQGDKYKVIAGKELLMSAITGLIFLILSVFLLRVIGVDILGINQIMT